MAPKPYHIAVRYHGLVKAALPAWLCFAGMLFCFWHVHRTKHAPPQSKVEITVYGPDGKVIPPLRRR